MNSCSNARVAFCLIAIGAASCASGITGSVDQIAAAQRVMRADITTCTQQFGYPPSDHPLGERELGTREIPWRECAYQAVRNYANAGPPMADALLHLIQEDKRMTTAIKDGTMTRAERSARLGQMISDMQAATAQDQQAAQIRRGLETFRR